MPGPSRKSLRRLKLRQLDDRLRPFQALRSVSAPKIGWLAEVRTCLGMTAEQMGSRLGLTKQRVGALERAEAEGKTTIASLRSAARALGCELVYALVPRGSLEEMVEHRAQAVAAEMVQRTAHSMWLERQGTSPQEVEAQTKDLTEKLKAEWSSRLWDAPARGR